MTVLIMDITGKEEHLRTLISELEEEGIPVIDKWAKVSHITLWSINGGEVQTFCHKQEGIKLNANLPSHRKHFIKKAKEVIN